MMLTPADIDSKRFSTTRLKEGYDQNEVDTFLDGVQEDFKFLIAQVGRIEEENRVLRRKLDAASEAPTAQLVSIPAAPTAVAEKLLAAAETAAKQHEDEAQRKADDVVREAGARGAQIVEEATAAAEKIKNEGLAEKYRRAEELDKRATTLEIQVASLNDRAAQVRRALTQALASYDKELTV